jgi:sec-independent protein translocase protein TatA
MMEVGVPELLIVLVVALVMFGPTRLPKLARSLGEAIHHFRAGINETADVAQDDDATDTSRDDPPDAVA